MVNASSICWMEELKEKSELAIGNRQMKNNLTRYMFRRNISWVETK